MTTLIHTLAVAEYLSFNRAAQALGTSQSSVSTRIRALEDYLGIALFDRNTRGVRLTEAGRRFVDEVHDAMSILDSAINTAGMQARGEEGELQIGVHALTAGGILDGLLERFHGKHPGVRLHITESTARDAQLMVREGKLDVAVMACSHEAPDLNSRVIWSDRLMAVMAVSHSLASRECVEWADLAAEIVMLRKAGIGSQFHDLIVMRSAGKRPVPTIRRFDVGRGALLSMIARGHGVSLSVEENKAIAPPGIAFRPILDEPETVAFSAVWSPRNRNPALRNLLDLANGMSPPRITY